jgi:hypothetical protein
MLVQDSTSETSDGLWPGPGSNPGSLLPWVLQPGGRLRQGPNRGRGRVRNSCPGSEGGLIVRLLGTVIAISTKGDVSGVVVSEKYVRNF